jgi:hypothetical protein
VTVGVGVTEGVGVIVGVGVGLIAHSALTDNFFPDKVRAVSLFEYAISIISCVC